MRLFDLFRKKQTYAPSEQDLRWNRFIEEVFSKDLSELNAIQKNAVLCFRYDAEVQNGGHGQYFDCYDDIDPQQVIAALCAIGYPEIVENFEKALNEGEKDDWAKTDSAYYRFSPSLIDCLQKYIDRHSEEIFG